MHLINPSDFAASPEGQVLISDFFQGRDVVLAIVEDSHKAYRLTGMVDRIEDDYVYLHNSEDPDDPIGYDLSIIDSIEVV
jgi:hypothetical protein